MRSERAVLTLVNLVSLMSVWRGVSSHGYLKEPPSRSSMWRVGFNTPRNYNDNELNCGGWQHQIVLGGKCGLCGDPYDGARQNEAGGFYARGVITRTYIQGGLLPIAVQITASHGGWFEFKLCANNNVTKPITQGCLDEHVLSRADNPGETKYTDVPYGGYLKPALIETLYRLPAKLRCQQCVLQWKYITAHNPGYAQQEEFYGCSDIEIVASPSVENSTTTKAATNITAAASTSTKTTKLSSAATTTATTTTATATTTTTSPAETTTSTTPITEAKTAATTTAAITTTATASTTNAEESERDKTTTISKPTTTPIGTSTKSTTLKVQTATATTKQSTGATATTEMTTGSARKTTSFSQTTFVSRAPPNKTNDQPKTTTTTTTAPNSTTYTTLSKTTTSQIDNSTATLTFQLLYKRCRAKGVLESMFTNICRQLCSIPDACLKTFCNLSCVRLEEFLPRNETTAVTTSA